MDDVEAELADLRKRVEELERWRTAQQEAARLIAEAGEPERGDSENGPPEPKNYNGLRFWADPAADTGPIGAVLWDAMAKDGTLLPDDPAGG